MYNYLTNLLRSADILNREYKKRIIVILLAVLAISFTACTSTDYTENIALGKEYPIELFPIIDGSNVYEYTYSNGIIDIKFGSDKEFEDVKDYYELVFAHNDYHNTIDKLTNKRYIIAGSSKDYSYLLEVSDAKSTEEKKHYKSIVSIRVVLNDIVDVSIDITPTPQVIVTNEPTPVVTPEPTATPEILVTPEPTESYLLTDSDFTNSVDLKESRVFIQASKAENKLEGEEKEILIQLEIINYSDHETGFIDISQFTLVDSYGIEYYPDNTNSILDTGVNVLAKGHAVALLKFYAHIESTEVSLVADHGIGNIPVEDLTIDLYGTPNVLFSGDYYDMIKGSIDKRVLPTFTTGQEHTFDDALSVALNNAEYFSTDGDAFDKYTYELTFTNITDNVIIPVELRDFALYDVYHNIIVKPTENLTPYDELGFNPVQSGVSKVYNISFEIFEEVGDEYLNLLVYSLDGDDNDILFTK